MITIYHGLTPNAVAILNSFIPDGEDRIEVVDPIIKTIFTSETQFLCKYKTSEGYWIEEFIQCQCKVDDEYHIYLALKKDGGLVLEESLWKFPALKISSINH
jgi:hypothetical protein